MALQRTQAKDRQYVRRGRGVMKKADDVRGLIEGVKAAVLFLDGTNLWIYESEDGWVSNLRSMSNIREKRMNPTHFMTVFEHDQAMASGSESATVDPPVLAQTAESSLFLSPEPQGPSLPSTPAVNKTTRPPRPLQPPIGRRDATSSTAAPRRTRRAGARPILGRAPRNTVREKQNGKDIYGFTDMDD